MESFSLFSLFVDHLDVNSIYELGWYAASQWMALIAGILAALAIGIRVAEEKINIISSGQSRYTELIVTTLLIVCAIALYFTLVDLTIRFFNAIYGALDSSSALVTLTSRLDEILDKVLSKEYSFSWHDLYNSVLAMFATILYAISYGVLVFVIVAMRVAHAILVSFCIFWGAVALPMSIVIGFRQLKAWKTLCLLALIWPIVDAFFVYLVGGSFSLMLDNTELGLNDVATWSMSMLLFYLGVFAIINGFLIAAVISAPIVAYSLVNGSGNVTGMIRSFGAAGISAGMMAGSAAMGAAGMAMGKATNKQPGQPAQKGSSSAASSATNTSSSSTGSSTQNANHHKSNSATNKSNRTVSTASPTLASASRRLQPQSSASPGNPTSSSIKTPSIKKPSSSRTSSTSSDQTSDSSSTTTMAAQAKRKSAARRGAVIQAQKKRPSLKPKGTS